MRFHEILLIYLKKSISLDATKKSKEIEQKHHCKENEYGGCSYRGEKRTATRKSAGMYIYIYFFLAGNLPHVCTL